MQAARYQMIIMFIISATTSVGAVSCLVSTSFYIVDMKVRLRLDRVHKKDRANNWSHRLAKQLEQVSALLVLLHIYGASVSSKCSS